MFDYPAACVDMVLVTEYVYLLGNRNCYKVSKVKTRQRYQTSLIKHKTISVVIARLYEVLVS